MTQENLTQGNKAPHKISSGAVRAVIWKNTSAEGNTYETVQLERSYKDAQGEWKSTNTLRVEDLGRAQLVLQEAMRHLTLR